MKEFPILHYPQRLPNCRDNIPWAMIAPHARRAEINHLQSLEVLAARGGLTEVELIAVLEGRDYQTRFKPYGVLMDDAQAAVDRLNELVAQYEAGLPLAVPVGGLVMAEPQRPRIVCLCGSSRFCDVGAVKAWELEKQGVMAIGMHLLPAWYTDKADHLAEHEGVAAVLDALHLKKIEMADSVLVLNVGGYIGERTRIEIEHAKRLGKPVGYLEAPSDARAEVAK